MQEEVSLEYFLYINIIAFPIQIVCRDVQKRYFDDCVLDVAFNGNGLINQEIYDHRCNHLQYEKSLAICNEQGMCNSVTKRCDCLPGLKIVVVYRLSFRFINFCFI